MSSKTCATFRSPLGMTTVEHNGSGISRISIAEEGSPTEELPDSLKEAVSQLKEYFSGNRQEFAFKVAPEGTDFQKRVWKHLLSIPYGTTVSYLDLAKEIGDTKAVRAVASANGKNPLWIVVPCHRVIGSNGSLTGYAGGLWRKKWLLDHENPPKQTELF